MGAGRAVFSLSHQVDRVAKDIDREVLRERLHSLKEPIAAVGIVVAGVGIDPTEIASAEDP